MDFSEQICLFSHLKSKGFNPKTIIDCGSNVGDWSRMIEFIYPDTPIHMIDILQLRTPEGEEPNKRVKNGIAHYGALDSEVGVKTLLHSPTYPELTTLFKDNWNPEEIFTTILVPTTTLDNIFLDSIPDGPILLKLDIQGAEIAALKGGRNTILPLTDVLITECSYHSFHEGGSDFRETINFLHDEGFELYEVLKCDFRRVLGPLFQCDAVFISKRMEYLWQK